MYSMVNLAAQPGQAKISVHAYDLRSKAESSLPDNAFL